jgi:hypothetical protein
MDRLNLEELSMLLFFQEYLHTSLTLDLSSCTEAVDCNHRVVIWNLLQHWCWDNIYEIPSSVGDMKLSWIILDHISGFENHINSAGAVVLKEGLAALSARPTKPLPENMGPTSHHQLAAAG